MTAKKAARKVAKKAATKTTTKSPAKKTAKKAVKAAKKAAVKAAPKGKAKTTAVTAKVDVGYGNTLYLRGEGGGLSWSAGVPMDCVRDDEWTWTTNSAKGSLVFKFLINDELWSSGDDLSIEAGGHFIGEPDSFQP